MSVQECGRHAAHHALDMLQPGEHVQVFDGLQQLISMMRRQRSEADQDVCWKLLQELQLVVQASSPGGLVSCCACSDRVTIDGLADAETGSSACLVKTMAHTARSEPIRAEARAIALHWAASRYLIMI